MKVRPYVVSSFLLPILPSQSTTWLAAHFVRRQHLEAIKPKIASGLVVMGGASLDEPISDPAKMKINGSVVMVEADTREEVS